MSGPGQGSRPQTLPAPRGTGGSTKTLITCSSSRSLSAWWWTAALGPVHASQAPRSPSGWAECRAATSPHCMKAVSWTQAASSLGTSREPRWGSVSSLPKAAAGTPGVLRRPGLAQPRELLAPGCGHPAACRSRRGWDTPCRQSGRRESWGPASSGLAFPGIFLSARCVHVLVPHPEIGLRGAALKASPLERQLGLVPALSC